MRSGYMFNRGPLNTTQLLANRSYYDIESIIRRRMQSATQLMWRLEEEATLMGHFGCVNRLEWSSNGRLLASVSDDTHLMIWDAYRHRRLVNIETPHHGNIFAVKFIPNSGDSLLATGAADCRVYQFDVERGGGHPNFKCVCHQLRVKSLATCPDNPFLLWTSSEDGKIFQFDLREKHVCQEANNNIVLLDLICHIGSQAEVKTIAINPIRTEMMAVGANDSYARVYDRRMLTLSKMGSRQSEPDYSAYRIDFSDTHPAGGDSTPLDAVQYYSPGHFAQHIDSTLMMHKAITHLTFSPDGNELLVNMGAEQIYLYDLNNNRKPVFVHLPGQENRSPSTVDNCVVDTKSTVAPVVEKMKKDGNYLLNTEKYLQAIQHYTSAIHRSPNYPVLYLNRATAFMRRNWYGDVYAALRDCITAIRLDPNYIKAHFRLSRALLQLGYVKEAGESLDTLIKLFPDYHQNGGVSMLRKDINCAAQSVKNENGGFNVSTKEMHWRGLAFDYEERFVGHCNTTTDIKEACFFGSEANYIVAGSDDGNFFIWQRSENVITKILKGDESIVNCVQPHPYMCMLATSGIGNEIRLWSPQSQQYDSTSIDETVLSNQLRMQQDPFSITERCTTS